MVRHSALADLSLRGLQAHHNPCSMPAAGVVSPMRNRTDIYEDTSYQNFQCGYAGKPLRCSQDTEQGFALTSSPISPKTHRPVHEHRGEPISPVTYHQSHQSSLNVLCVQPVPDAVSKLTVHEPHPCPSLIPAAGASPTVSGMLRSCRTSRPVPLSPARAPQMLEVNQLSVSSDHLSATMKAFHESVTRNN